MLYSLGSATLPLRGVLSLRPLGSASRLQKNLSDKAKFSNYDSRRHRMQRERKGTGIIIVIFALAAMLTTEWISNLAREKNLRNPTQIVSTTSLPNDKKHAAFLAARASVLADLAGPGTAVSAPENQAGFRETPTENYIALRVEITDNHNQRVRENWIVGLEPDTNVVRSKVKEEAAATGTPGQ